MGGEGWTWERGLPDWLWLARDDDAGGRNGWRAEQPAPQLTWIGFSVGDFLFFFSSLDLEAGLLSMRELVWFTF
jgi:hypothetical protein